jgi:putative flippase GtrA
MKEWLLKHMKLIRYLLAGGYNTLFGFAVFAGLYLLLLDRLNYLLIACISQVIAITNAFVIYKFWVFKSQGNILTEYYKTYLVYGVSFVLGLVGLGLLVEVLHIHPILAQAIITILTVCISYLGHSHYAFAQKN